jgi:hypothetical protein
LEKEVIEEIKPRLKRMKKIINNLERDLDSEEGVIRYAAMRISGALIEDMKPMSEKLITKQDLKILIDKLTLMAIKI